MNGVPRAPYVAVAAVPVTIPYVRYSSHGAHWFVARALRALLQGSGLRKSDLDGFCLSSFTLAPDTAVGVTQHLGLSLRWL
ncbi:MAG: thiolase family protein, partial [Steroidobacteraceae bacterium]